MDRIAISLIEAEFARYKALGESAFGQLAAADLSRADPGSNSIATLVWHISSNLESRFTDFLTADGEKPWRDREGEFRTREASLEEVRDKWERGWSSLLKALAGLSDADLARTVTIRGVALRVDEALLRSLGHTSYHVGQIVYLAKSFRGEEWRYLSIPPGGSAAYNANPVAEKPLAQARRLSEPR